MSGDIVVAYHGCDFDTAIQLTGDDYSHLRPSKNPYDWLGEGIYFFEGDGLRAKMFAEAAAEAPHLNLTACPILRSYAIGAVIQLGNCLDLTTQAGIEEIKLAYAALEEDLPAGFELPRNRSAGPDDLEGILHHLDRAVINHVHGQRIKFGQPPYDTVRGLFAQGQPVFPTSAIRRLSHIQIAVRNADCILGYFHPKLPIKDSFQGLNRLGVPPYRRTPRQRA
ncbi:hypothetical protein SAMN05216319_1740 [Duganella sp. CF402]|uniref:hypothetical protein n=1 Tax=unclassified Duganella TaxID=2636909 RepID=UPI0008C98215|nr:MULTISPECIES: hypothetical protein [unclassified Duganella]RZT09817.1 hypothetical protein EV582_1888 [Duganella sp. BK701]SEL41626.1 hypothetical protein SAMN05216319_1740 [Duganella sp. CF402]